MSENVKDPLMLYLLFFIYFLDEIDGVRHWNIESENLENVTSSSLIDLANNIIFEKPHEAEHVVMIEVASGE